MESVINKSFVVLHCKAIVMFVLFIGAITTLFINPSYAKYASIVLDAETGDVLRSRNADTKNYPASLTKLMTLYLLFEKIEEGSFSMATKLRVSKRAAGQPASKLGLVVGETITVRQAIKALAIKSANDVATVVAEAIGNTEWEFAQDMTKRARDLGMKNTRFRNASGLPNRRQLSSARDMGTLAMAILRDFPDYYRYFSEAKFTHDGRVHKSHNKLLSSYPGMDGLKTGYIRASGFNLVASASRNDRRIIAVVFGGKTAKSRDSHMVKLLNLGFKRLPVKVKKNRNGSFSNKITVALPIYKPRPRRNFDTNIFPHPPKPSLKQWSVQVGAFQSLESAQHALNEVAVSFPKLLGHALSAVFTVKTKDGNILYRARFYGLEKEIATKACNSLQILPKLCVVRYRPENYS